MDRYQLGCISIGIGIDFEIGEVPLDSVLVVT